MIVRTIDHVVTSVVGLLTGCTDSMCMQLLICASVHNLVCLSLVRLRLGVISLCVNQVVAGSIN